MPIQWDQPKPQTGGIVWDKQKGEGLAADSGVANGLPSASGAGMQHVGNMVKGSANTLGRALDAQRWGVARVTTGQSDPDTQRATYRKNIPYSVAYPVVGAVMGPLLAGKLNPSVEDVYQRLGNMHLRIPTPNLEGGNVDIGSGVGHTLQGVNDLYLDTITDPLTYETLGLAPITKGVQAGLRMANNATHFTPMLIRSMQSLHATPFGQKLATVVRPIVAEGADLGRSVYDGIHDFVHWGGEVKRKFGNATWNRVRGAANMASSNGWRVQQHLVRRFDAATKGLTDDELRSVGQALNGEILPKDLGTKEFSAYRQLRTLTELDYKMRFDAAQTIAFNNYTRGMNQADKSAIWDALQKGKPPEVPSPQGGVRKRPTIDGEEVQGPLRPTRMRITNQRAQAQARRSQDINQSAATQFAQDLYAGKISPQRIGAMLRTLNPAVTDQEVAQLTTQGVDALRDRYVQELQAKGINLGPTSMIPAKRYNLRYANQAQIDRSKMLLDKYNEIHNTVMENMPKRESYMPIAPAPKTDEPRATQTISQASEFDPRAQHREDVKITSADQVRKGFEAMASNTNRRVTAGAIHQALGELLDDPAVSKLFDQTLHATGAARTSMEKFRDAWLAAVGYPRAAVVSITPRHAANILDLLANTVPPQYLAQTMKDTMALAAKLVKANPKEYAELTREGRELGALSGAFTERKAFFQNVPIVRNWTQLNNKLVWAVDEAAKQTYAKLLLKTGEATHPLEAGGMASSRLVDYEHTAPLVKNFMRYVAPFGTFRGSIPGAVAGGVARNPARAAFLNRATGGAMYGGKNDQQGGITMYNPTADVGRMLDMPTGRDALDQFQSSGLVNYARGSLAAPAAGALDLGEDLLTGFSQGRGSHLASYGQPWLPQRTKNGQLDLGFLVDSALAGVPEAGTILESMGISRFKWKGMAKELARQTIGIGLPNSPQPPPSVP